MDTREAIDQIKLALADLQSKGQHFVHIPALIRSLDALEKGATLSAETRKLQHESDLEWYKAQRQSEVEMFKSVIQTGQTALKTSIIVPGGAAVALLAFIGNIWSETQSVVVAKALTLSVLLFSAGVLLGAVATGTTYLSQAAYAHKWRRTGVGFHAFTIASVVAAYIVFGIGVWFAYKAFFTQLAP